MTRMNSISAAAPTVTRPVGRRPVTRLVSRTRDLPPRTSSGADDRFQFRDRRPRYLPVRSRGGVARNVRLDRREVGNGTLVPIRRRRRSGASGAPGRDARTRCQCAPPPAACGGDSGYPVTHARTPPPRPPRARARARRSHACGGAAPPSFDPTGSCSADGRAARRLPGPRGARPGELPGRTARDARFRTQLLRGRTSARSRPGASGRCASPAGRGRSGPSGPRSSRSSARHGLTADALADVLHGQRQGRGAGPTSPAHRQPMIAGRPGHRLDTKTGERVQTVVVWPAAAERRRQRGHHQRPAGCPDPGRHRRVRRTADAALRRSATGWSASSAGGPSRP